MITHVCRKAAGESTWSNTMVTVAQLEVPKSFIALNLNSSRGTRASVAAQSRGGTSMHSYFSLHSSYVLHSGAVVLSQPSGPLYLVFSAPVLSSSAFSTQAISATLSSGHSYPLTHFTSSSVASGIIWPLSGSMRVDTPSAASFGQLSQSNLHPGIGFSLWTPWLVVWT